ncbi:ABC-type glycerol-3-phosphate transport system permease component [Catenulispora sp. GP43]
MNRPRKVGSLAAVLCAGADDTTPVTIPQEYLDAARIDGCGEVRVVFRVVVPMTRPAIAAVALFQFFSAWNDFGLAVEWNLTIAATLIAMAPVIIVFFLAQRAFIEGVTMTGVKG